MPDAVSGELQLNNDGLIVVTRQPSTPENIPSGSDLLARRLFFPVRISSEAGMVILLCNIYYEQVLIQSRFIQAYTEECPSWDWT